MARKVELTVYCEVKNLSETQGNHHCVTLHELHRWTKRRAMWRSSALRRVVTGWMLSRSHSGQEGSQVSITLCNIMCERQCPMYYMREGVSQGLCAGGALGDIWVCVRAI